MEIKEEINHLVDVLPDEVLDDVLRYLREVEKATPEKMRLSLNLKSILIEDHDLLQKLAK